MTTQTETAPSSTARLLPSLVLVVAVIAVALLFGSAFETYAPAAQRNADTGADCGTPDPQATDDTHTDHADAAEAGPPTPMYFAGGLWSDELGLAALAEIAVMGLKRDGPVVCQSVSWDGEALTAIDVSPITLDATDENQQPALAIVSVDHAGGDPSPEFAVAIQTHLETLAEAKAVLVLAPLPGPTPRGDDEFPYDWTFLMLDEKTDVLDFVEIEPAEGLPGKPGSGYLKAWLDSNTQTSTPDNNRTASQLLGEIDVSSNRGVYPQLLWELVSIGPYQVVPAVNKDWRKGGEETNDSLTDFHTTLALLLYRSLGIHADAFIDHAAASEDPKLRAMAARAIGGLADVTTDPLGRLTPLAEDKDMRVRYEALVATRAVPGRRAAGIAQLVEPYAMTADMRALYESTMAELLAFGDPVPADSRADRLRRLAINELLAEERDAIVCTILLERTDLPDDKIAEVLGQLAEANGNGPLVALLNLLESMNPRTLANRDALLKVLARWDADELRAQRSRLLELMQQNSRPQQVKAAASAALLRALPTVPAVLQSLGGARPIIFEGLARVEDRQVIERWTEATINYATGLDGIKPLTQIAALDALVLIPTDKIKPALPKLLREARGAEEVDIRFAAIRAINALPDAIQPGDIDDLRLTQLTLVAVPGKIAYDKAKLSAIAGRPVEITLVNPDTMEHNLVITKPGRAQEVGVAISAMSPAEAAGIAYIPESDAVLHHSEMLRPGASTTLRFVAPATPGKYEYVCTFPGHYTSMIGVLEIVAP